MKEKIHLIITGGSSGLGKKIVNYYSKKVSLITIIDKTKNELKESNFIKLDLTKVKKFNLINEKKFFLHKNCYYKCSSTKIKKIFI